MNFLVVDLGLDFWVATFSLAVLVVTLGAWRNSDFRSDLFVHNVCTRSWLQIDFQVQNFLVNFWNFLGLCLCLCLSLCLFPFRKGSGPEGGVLCGGCHQSLLSSFWKL